MDSPFKAGDEFDIRVRILPGKFQASSLPNKTYMRLSPWQVFGNRVQVGTFDQRIPLYGVV